MWLEPERDASAVFHLNQLLSLNEGAYEDNYTLATVIVLREFSPDAAMKLFLGAHTPRSPHGSFLLREFAVWLIKEGYIRQVPRTVWDFGSGYGHLQMYLRPDRELTPATDERGI